MGIGVRELSVGVSSVAGLFLLYFVCLFNPVLESHWVGVGNKTLLEVGREEVLELVQLGSVVPTHLSS